MGDFRPPPRELEKFSAGVTSPVPFPKLLPGRGHRSNALGLRRLVSAQSQCTLTSEESNYYLFANAFTPVKATGSFREVWEKG